MKEFKDKVAVITGAADGIGRAIADREEKFYIFPHPDLKAGVRLRMEDILQERNPTNPLL